MTKETQKLLQEFAGKYDDISKINLLDYEQFLIGLLELELQKAIVKELYDILNLYKKEQEEKLISFSKFINLILEKYNKVYNYHNTKHKRRRYSNILLSESGDISPLLESYTVKRDNDLDLELMFLNQRMKKYDRPGKDITQLTKKYISD